MTNPIPPISQKVFYLVRKIRLLIFLILIIFISYLFFTFNSWLGILLAVISSILWYIEIQRGNQTEDYIIDNYENPLK